MQMKLCVLFVQDHNHSNKKLLVAKGIATRSKKLVVAPGLTTRHKKLLGGSFAVWAKDMNSNSLICMSKTILTKERLVSWGRHGCKVTHEPFPKKGTLYNMARLSACNHDIHAHTSTHLGCQSLGSQEYAAQWTVKLLDPRAMGSLWSRTSYSCGLIYDLVSIVQIML